MTCLKCGDCCKGFTYEEGFIWMTNKMYERHPKFHPLKVGDLGLLGKLVKIPTGKDRKCPYLNENNECETQMDKPLMCVIYFCDKALEN